MENRFYLLTFAINDYELTTIGIIRNNVISSVIFKINLQLKQIHIHNILCTIVPLSCKINNDFSVNIICVIILFI